MNSILTSLPRGVEQRHTIFAVDEDTAMQLENIIRRVVREELAMSRIGKPLTSKPAPRAERRRGAHGSEGMENLDMTLAYLNTIDPEGRMTQAESLNALRFRFPQFDL